MFPEGHGAPRAARIVGAAAPFVNALVVNAKGASDELWKRRGYKPTDAGRDQGAARLLEPTSVGPRREPGTFSDAHPKTMAAGAASSNFKLTLRTCTLFPLA